MLDSKRSIISVIARKPARALTCAALAVAFATAPVVAPVSAYAVSSETQAAIDEADAQVDQYAAAYNDATAKLQELQGKIDENTQRIAELEEKLPAQQEAASEAMRDLYKFQNGSNPLMSMVLNSESLSDFITTCVYMDEIQATSNKAIDDLDAMQTELQQTKSELEQQKAQLQDEQQKASDALASAQASRSAAQKKAEEEAAAELAAMAQDTAPAEGEGESGGNPNSTATTPNQTVTTQVASGAVDWNNEHDAFISEWTDRINNYLAGSPLAGYGSVFAEAAWNTGVDPRWSPAIATIESSKGLYCAGSYNAWGMSKAGGGWMSFGSWNEAITYHVSYLKRVYGTTLTPAAAQKYCPPTWQDWYNKVAAQMNRI